jgi:alkylation response protein AidB-like acyl-CoA dehydrogenase
MDFTFEEEQRLAAQSLRALLDDHCTGADLRRAAEALDFESYRAACAMRAGKLAELGLAGMLVPDSQGGLGLGPADFVLLAEEAGWAALPEPLVESEGVANVLLAELTRHDAAAGEVLGEVLAGSALVLCAPPGVDVVSSIGLADYLLTGAHDGELAVYRTSELAIESATSVDPLRRLGRIRQLPGRPLASLGGEAARLAWQAAEARSAVFIAAQLLGLAARMTALAVAYALERKQFGRAIAANQAVKHQLADVQIRTEFARPVVYAASAAPGGVRAAHALIAAGDAAQLAAQTAIQVHGAMGYSWEVDLQFYAKRAWALTGLQGGRTAQFRRVHAALRNGALPIGPDRLFDQVSLQGAQP